MAERRSNEGPEAVPHSTLEYLPQDAEVQPTYVETGQQPAVPDRKSPRKWMWIAIVVLVVLLIGAIVGGAVGGTFAKKRHDNAQTK